MSRLEATDNNSEGLISKTMSWKRAENEREHSFSLASRCFSDWSFLFTDNAKHMSFLYNYDISAIIQHKRLAS